MGKFTEEAAEPEEFDRTAELSEAEEPAADQPWVSDSPFTLAMAQRAGALGLAREVLKSESGTVMGLGGSAFLPKHFTSTDLLLLAEWIVVGPESIPNVATIDAVAF